MTWNPTNGKADYPRAVEQARFIMDDVVEGVCRQWGLPGGAFGRAVAEELKDALVADPIALRILARGIARELRLLELEGSLRRNGFMVRVENGKATLRGDQSRLTPEMRLQAQEYRELASA